MSPYKTCPSERCDICQKTFYSRNITNKMAKHKTTSLHKKNLSSKTIPKDSWTKNDPIAYNICMINSEIESTKSQISQNEKQIKAMKELMKKLTTENEISKGKLSELKTDKKIELSKLDKQITKINSAKIDSFYITTLKPVYNITTQKTSKKNKTRKNKNKKQKQEKTETLSIDTLSTDTLSTETTSTTSITSITSTEQNNIRQFKIIKSRQKLNKTGIFYQQLQQNKIT